MDQYGHHKPKPKTQTTRFRIGGQFPDSLDLIFIGIDVLIVALVIHYREHVLLAIAGAIYRLVPLIFGLLALIVILLIKIRRSETDRRRNNYRRDYDRRDW